jgi:hypothetical protein
VAPVLFGAGLWLLALPAAGRRLGLRLAPAEWSRLCATALVLGAVVLELSMVLYATPTLLRASGAEELAPHCPS